MSIFELDEFASRNAWIRVIGVGCSGGHAVNRMITEHLQGVKFISVNTDTNALINNKADIKIQIGKKLTRGRGTGARPEIGRQAVEENRDEVMRCIQNADLVFVVSGLGGGTGTGAAPIIAGMARDMGILTVGIVTRPFLIEGKKRMRVAETGIREMSKQVDTMIIVPYERLLAVVCKGVALPDTFKKADELLLNATRSISDVITKPRLVDVGFADVQAVMQNGGLAQMGIGVGKGEARAVKAAKRAISSPLLDSISINGATRVLLNMTGGEDLTLDEVLQISRIVQDIVGDEAHMIFTAVLDPFMQGEIRVTVIGTGFDKVIATKKADVIPFPQRKVVGG